MSDPRHNRGFNSQELNGATPNSPPYTPGRIPNPNFNFTPVGSSPSNPPTGSPTSRPASSGSRRRRTTSASVDSSSTASVVQSVINEETESRTKSLCIYPTCTKYAQLHQDLCGIHDNLIKKRLVKKAQTAHIDVQLRLRAKVNEDFIASLKRQADEAVRNAQRAAQQAFAPPPGTPLRRAAATSYTNHGASEDQADDGNVEEDVDVNGGAAMENWCLICEIVTD